jgi:hypothetical protein
MSDISASPESLLPDALKAEVFLEANSHLKVFQYRSDVLKAFVTQFEERALSPKGAEVLAGLEKLLEDEAWCVSHDAAHGALKEALQLVQKEEHAGVRQAVEMLHSMQMVSSSALTLVEKDEAIREVLQPLKDHLNPQHNPAGTGNWVQCSARRLSAAEGAESKTLAQARVQLAALPKLAGVFPQGVEAAAASPAKRFSMTEAMQKMEASARNTTALPSGGGSSGYSGGFGYYDYSPSTHVCGAGCSHDHGPVSSSSAHVCDSGCGHTHAASSGGYAYSGEYGTTSGAAATQAAEGNVLQRGEAWLKRQKPSNVIGAAAAVAAGVGLLYASGKAEQRRQEEARSAG